jgi:hypothetical protein
MATRLPKQVTQEIKELNRGISEQKETVIDLESVQIEEKRNDSGTRQKIAKQFVIFYFGLLAAIVLCVPIYNYFAYKQEMKYSDVTYATSATTMQRPEPLRISLPDLIQTYSAIVGPTLGFVIAYYFKSKNDA